MSLADPATLRTRVEETGLLWGLVGLVALLSLLPIGRLIVEGLAPGGQLSATALGKVMASPATWTATWNSLTTAIAGTILATLIGGTVALLATLIYQRPVTRDLAQGTRTRTVVAGLGTAALAICAVLWVTTSQETGWLYRGGFPAYAVLSALVVLAAVVIAAFTVRF